MQNPLGADNEDLPVLSLVETAVKTSRSIVAAKPPGVFAQPPVVAPQPQPPAQRLPKPQLANRELPASTSASSELKFDDGPESMSA